ncbi:hypothetical protein BKA67DRAFT_536507 [Truncatella angustata]|uniref:Uncharacterized protein n=1 Tax=Truncatella angustata TaxID=152316 RepID=A0A9P8ZWB0_9PEZI|nr:uncharacterized protein BKA67DRAFT_536507 [Truncatella angustata]KAH6652787.1 hypothetical protein BKA67DRAFT_536507 [Truncatella angustata]KAH8204696.1 hypothetical protein TruAng_001171 [Truncatella angustata]
MEMDLRAKLANLESECMSYMKLHTLRRQDICLALSKADEAHDLAEIHDLGANLVTRYERLGDFCVERLKRDFGRDAKHERNAYAESADKSWSLDAASEAGSVDIDSTASQVGGIGANSMAIESTLKNKDGEKKDLTVSFEEPRVRMQNGDEKVVGLRRSPDLRTKTGQSFEDWQNLM